MEFQIFKTEVQRQYNKLKEHELFRVQVDKDVLWGTYLNSFPEGTNKIYKERREYDCNSCQNFIRNAGNMVAIVNGEIVSIWDVQVDGYFQVVADALSALVKAAPIENKFLHFEKTVGTDQNYQLLESGTTKTWKHFYIQLQPGTYTTDLGSALADTRSTRDVMLRSLTELSLDAVDTVLELISQNSLYRGEEHKFALESFKALKEEFANLTTDQAKDIFCWSRIKAVPASVSKIRNTAIGTLLVDLSEGKELVYAVIAFEKKVAGDSYKRPVALESVTKAQYKAAKKDVDEQGLTSALHRRYAALEDISINDIIFADRNAKKRMDNIFDELSDKVSDKVKNLDKVEEVTIQQFIENIVPKADSIEVLFENRHLPNLVSLIAPCDLTARPLFKWDNQLSWSYKGDTADSIKERIKAAGGRVDGVLRFSVQWSEDFKDNSDLDAHCQEPYGHIHYSNMRVASGGNLDIDIRYPFSQCPGKPAVENITYPDKSRMKDGVYKFWVNQYSARNSLGCNCEIEFDGKIFNYSYPHPVRGDIPVAAVTLKNGEFSIKHILECSNAVKEVWGLSTQSFQKVSVISYSPNYWGDRPVGNKHYFFMLEGCVNSEKARGFYNEYLKEDLNKHRKVMEIVASKMKTEETENQLSGLGFSSTQRNSILCRVKGSFSRIIKVTF